MGRSAFSNQVTRQWLRFSIYKILHTAQVWGASVTASPPSLSVSLFILLLLFGPPRSSSSLPPQVGPDYVCLVCPSAWRAVTRSHSRVASPNRSRMPRRITKSRRCAFSGSHGPPPPRPSPLRPSCCADAVTKSISTREKIILQMPKFMKVSMICCCGCRIWSASREHVNFSTSYPEYPMTFESELDFLIRNFTSSYTL